MMHKTQQARREGFSLIEVILAIAVFALTIVAVLAMLGSTTQATSEVLNTVTASRISDAIRTELENLDFNDLDPNAVNYPVTLYGRQDGSRVVLDTNADNNPDPEVDDPPGIAERDRYFLIELDVLGDELVYDVDNADIALSVRLEWPYMLPLGPRSANPMNDPTKTTEPFNRSVSIFNVSIPKRL